MSSEKLHHMPEEKAFEPAGSFSPKISENLIDRINDNPKLHIFNKAVRNALIGAQVVGLTLTSAGCVRAIQTVERATSVAPSPTVTMTETPTVEPTPENKVLTPEDVKNMPPAILLSQETSGVLTGLPESLSQEDTTSAKNEYNAIQKKFPGSNVYFAQDPQSGEWILFATMSGYLYHESVLNPDTGVREYTDYPIRFQEVDGKLSVAGTYERIKTNIGINVMWLNGFPVFFTGKEKTANGDTYYRLYLEHKTPITEANPWKEIPGVASIVESEAPKYEPGTVILDPEYNFDGQIEIIKENNDAFYDNFLDSLIRINRGYFKALKTNAGTHVTDAKSLRTYLGENEWIIPEGIQIPTKALGPSTLLVELTSPSQKKVSLKNLEIVLVDISDFQKSTGNEFENSNCLFSIYYDIDRGNGLAVGYVMHDNGDIVQLTLVIVQKSDISGVGFPTTGESLSASQLDSLNIYLRFILYSMRTMQINPPSDLEKTVSALGYFGKSAFLNHIDTLSGVGIVAFTPGLFETFVQYNPKDSAPEIIRLKN